MRARRVGRLPVVIAFSTASLVVALTAGAVVRDRRTPPMSMCLGSTFPVDTRRLPVAVPRWASGRAARSRIAIFGPRGAKVFQRRVRGGRGRGMWPFKPRRTGIFRFTYSRGPKRAEFELLVVRCSRGVKLRLNDRRRAMLRLVNAKPGDSDTACVLVTHAGKSPASVRLFGRTTGTGLDRYVALTVIRGQLSRISFDSCRTFTPDRKSYIGAGKGVVYRGTLAGFPDDFRTARPDPSRRWKPGVSHAYKFVAVVQDTNAAQGLRATQTFTWVARSLTLRAR